MVSEGAYEIAAHKSVRANDHQDRFAVTAILTLPRPKPTACSDLCISGADLASRPGRHLKCFQMTGRFR